MPNNYPRFKIKQVLTRSKANKICYFFSPKEPVAAEKFDLGLIIVNLTQNVYKNCSVLCVIRYANTAMQLRIPFDILKPNEEKEIWLLDQTAFSSGPILLDGFVLMCDGKHIARGNSTPGSFIDSMNQPINKRNPLIFNVATREELYQKYSVVVAIWASTISIIIATIGILISILF